MSSTSTIDDKFRDRTRQIIILIEINVMNISVGNPQPYFAISFIFFS